MGLSKSSLTGIRHAIFLMQKGLLCFCHAAFFCVKPEAGLWVVGVDEIAGVISRNAQVFDKSFSVNFSANKYYQSSAYQFDLRKIPILKGKWASAVARMIAGPILLAYLTRRASGFFYIWKTGFMLHELDGRAYEFSYLKKHHKKIVTFFVGSDIRSLHLSQEYAAKEGVDLLMTYQYQLNPSYDWAAREVLVRKTAQSADRYADYIFNAPVDQISYLKRDVHPCILAFPDEGFVRNDKKFENIQRIKIVHAPSSPFIKGTQIIRAAIKNLQSLGYDFDYIEILNTDNSIVLEQLRSAHIVINELYAFVPGMFGLEAMASHCALITSADRNCEPSLAEGANEAWFVTKYWEMYDHLKALLDDTDLMKKYADTGYAWALKNGSVTAVRNNMRLILQADL